MAENVIIWRKIEIFAGVNAAEGGALVREDCVFACLHKINGYLVVNKTIFKLKMKNSIKTDVIKMVRLFTRRRIFVCVCVCWCITCVGQ